MYAQSLNVAELGHTSIGRVCQYMDMVRCSSSADSRSRFALISSSLRGPSPKF